MSAAGGGSGGAGRHPFLDRLENALTETRVVKIERLLQSICGRPALLSRHFGEIEQLMRAHGRQAVLDAAVRKAIASGDIPEAMLKKFAGAGSPARTDGTSVFPPAAGNARPPADVWRNAGTIVERAWQLADEITIDPRLAEKLFTRTQMPNLTREVWERGFRFAAALESLTGDKGFRGEEMAALFHPETGTRLRDANNQQPALYVIGHLGFSAARNYFIRKYLKNSIPFRPSLNRPPYVWELNDGRTALFCGLRALSAGLSIIVAPDGPMGTLRSAVDVAGSEAAISTGAVFLAHETRLEVFWLNIEFTDGCFVPVLVKAPQALPKEKLKDYQLRFVIFYQDMLNRYFTGDPANLVIRNRWKATFLGDAQQGAGEE